MLLRERRRRRVPAIVLVALLAVGACGRQDADRFVLLHSPIVAISHVRVIDGTGAPGAADQTIVIRDGRILTVAPSAAIAIPPNARVVDRSGCTVIPGLVGMHEHLFYQMGGPGAQPVVLAAPQAFARLYLAAGVTTIRTGGTVDFDGDLRIKQRIDAGIEPGPKIHLTGPYLNAVGPVPNPEVVTRRVADAIDRGATSIKAYDTLRTAELRAAIQAAHARGVRVAGHLCAVGYREAVALGIDSIEHGLVFDTDFDSAKRPDECPPASEALGAMLQVRVTDDAVRATIADLVRHGVAMTSTLAVLESLTGQGRPDARVPEMLSWRWRRTYAAARESSSADPNAPWPRAWSNLLAEEMRFERAFVAAGGTLMAGVDPTGWGGVVAGFGDQRELELLVDAGFTPEQAVRIATANGADFLSEKDIGRIAPGNRADLVVVRGDLSTDVSRVRNVEMVMKDGVGYDPAALIDDARGSVGAFDIRACTRWPTNALAGAGLAILTALFLRRGSRRRGNFAR